MTPQLLVIAKAPVPGRVKTRLCPPYTPEQAARLAAAALTDTLETVRAARASRRVLVLSGALGELPPGFQVIPQRGDGLAERLAAAFADTARPCGAFLVGMDTPQLTDALLDAATTALTSADAVLGLAADGGWWGLGLRDATHADALPGIPMSTASTGADTLAALRERDLDVALLPVLQDVDTAADARAVARQTPGSRFAAELARLDGVAAVR